MARQNNTCWSQKKKNSTDSIVVLNYTIDITIGSYHTCLNDQLYINQLYTLLNDIYAFWQTMKQEQQEKEQMKLAMGNKKSNGIKFLKISQLITTYFPSTLDLDDVYIPTMATIEDILGLSTKILHETSIRCIQLGGLKLSKQNIDFLKFWFVKPFGEYSYDVTISAKKKRYDLKPFSSTFRYRANSGDLTMSRWCSV